MTFFLKIPVFMSADIMASLCDVRLRVSVNNFSSKTTRPRDMLFFTPQPLRAVGVLFSPMVSGWVGGRPVGRAGGWAAGKSLSGLYLRNRKV